MEITIKNHYLFKSQHAFRRLLVKKVNEVGGASRWDAKVLGKRAKNVRLPAAYGIYPVPARQPARSVNAHLDPVDNTHSLRNNHTELYPEHIGFDISHIVGNP